ncbi:hypothetical protein AU381_00330 [Sinorhizobium glycinis]|uniref:Uncharacterized protein n=1 Tax=Sinorhizobium glycinis TaxID=1472378 RepID=A0A178Y081_9HYPH|nr:hypothetical protein AU381_00330 [Sinorhizobium glycinis]
MAYLEDLPDSCPPREAIDESFGPAYRMLPAAVPILEHFHSHRKLGRQKPHDVTECRFASCSLFMSLEKTKRIARMPKMRSKVTHIGVLNVPQGSGSWLENDREHVDFWMYDGFDPTGHIAEVIEL